MVTAVAGVVRVETWSWRRWVHAEAGGKDMRLAALGTGSSHETVFFYNTHETVFVLTLRTDDKLHHELLHIVFVSFLYRAYDL